jgi:hypothetical protein
MTAMAAAHAVHQFTNGKVSQRRKNLMCCRERLARKERVTQKWRKKEKKNVVKVKSVSSLTPSDMASENLELNQNAADTLLAAMRLARSVYGSEGFSEIVLEMLEIVQDKQVAQPMVGSNIHHGSSGSSRVLGVVAGGVGGDTNMRDVEVDDGGGDVASSPADGVRGDMRDVEVENDGDVAAQE